MRAILIATILMLALPHLARPNCSLDSHHISAAIYLPKTDTKALVERIATQDLLQKFTDDFLKQQTNNLDQSFGPKEPEKCPAPPKINGNWDTCSGIPCLPNVNEDKICAPSQGPSDLSANVSCTLNSCLGKPIPSTFTFSKWNIEELKLGSGAIPVKCPPGTKENSPCFSISILKLKIKGTIGAKSIWANQGSPKDCALSETSCNTFDTLTPSDIEGGFSDASGNTKVTFQLNENGSPGSVIGIDGTDSSVSFGPAAKFLFNTDSSDPILKVLKNAIVPYNESNGLHDNSFGIISGLLQKTLPKIASDSIMPSIAKDITIAINTGQMVEVPGINADNQLKKKAMTSKCSGEDSDKWLVKPVASQTMGVLSDLNAYGFSVCVNCYQQLAGREIQGFSDNKVSCPAGQIKAVVGAELINSYLSYINQCGAFQMTPDNPWAKVAVNPTLAPAFDISQDGTMSLEFPMKVSASALFGLIKFGDKEVVKISFKFEMGADGKIVPKITGAASKKGNSKDFDPSKVSKSASGLLQSFLNINEINDVLATGFQANLLGKISPSQIISDPKSNSLTVCSTVHE